MRRFHLAAMALAAALVLVPLPVAANGAHGQIGHLDVSYGPLAPNESRFFYLNPEEDRTMARGWVFLVYGYNQGPGPLDVRLIAGGTVVKAWRWAPQTFNLNTTALTFTGLHEIQLRNPSPDQTAGYVLYFDQSCNCLGKQIPLDKGTVFFHYDLPAGRDVELQFPLVKGWTVKATLATLREPGGVWPQDFQDLSRTTESGPNWLNVSFRTEQAERYYVFMEAIEGAKFDFNNPKTIQLTPLLDVKAADTPGLPGLVILGAVLGTAAWVGRKNRATP